MGHDVHITRHENWWIEEAQDINAADWEAVVADDPSVVMAPMWWTGDRIASRNPSDAVIATMCQVAKVLYAQVQGDDGEYYDA
ncbi:hypothetical protein [Kitasatospora sp. CB02891]|uniref:hypothetical protein n=1 Tax=Kitasatospora sp. CB02891 TaxID=2020329 RepID=UPI000C278BB7|nr:hypothetical protein [Kitasatospora sp. CB02891]PJN27837.1 hypothetical protein CG736_06425 [Kitasatospora sp. CB02891]